MQRFFAIRPIKNRFKLRLFIFIVRVCAMRVCARVCESFDQRTAERNLLGVMPVYFLNMR